MTAFFFNETNVIEDQLASNSASESINEHKYLRRNVNQYLKLELSYYQHMRYRLLQTLLADTKDAPSQVKYLAYTSIIRPKFEYGSIIWDPHRKINIDCPEIIQRRAVHFVYRTYGQTYSVSALMERNCIPTLESRHKSFRLKLSLGSSPYISFMSTWCSRHSHALALTPYFTKTNLFKSPFFLRMISGYDKLSFATILSTDSIDAHVYLVMQ